MTDLTSLANVEQALGLSSGNSDEALLARLISAASAFIETWCGRQFASQSYTEIRDGGGGRRLAFRQTPVTAISSLVSAGQAIPAGDSYQTPGYYFTPVMLMLNGYEFRRGLGNIQLVYTAGYASIPLDVEQACIELVMLRYKELPHFDKSSEGGLQQTTTFIVRDMKPSTQTLLNNYRRVVPV